MRARPGVILMALTMAVFLVTVNVTVVTVALPSLSADLHAAPDTSEWVIDAYNLVGASLLLAAGSLADRFGRRRALLTGYAIFTVGALLCSVAPTVGWLIAFRVVQAVGGTALTPTSLAIVANLYPDPRARAHAIGIWGVASGLGTGAGPVIGGVMTDWLGWRSVFGANAVMGAAALAVAFLVVPRSRAAHARRLDWRGQVVAVLLLSSLTYALIEAPRYGWTSPRILAPLIADVFLVALFCRVELRVREPMIDLHFFGDRQFSGIVFITVAAFFAFSGFVFFNALYLQEARGYSPLAAGVLTLPAALPVLALGPVAGWLVGARGARGVVTAGTGMMAAGLAILASLPFDASVEELIAAYLVLGVGYALINPPVSTVAVGSMPRDRAAVAAAVASTARNVGLVLGIAVLGTVVNDRLPGLREGLGFPEAFTEAVRVAYVLAAVVSATAAATALWTLRSQPPGAEVAGAAVGE